MTTATNVSTPSDEELAAQWQERVRTGNFSPAVQGKGIILVMGPVGDAPVEFPRIASLDALGTLALDEQYAVRAAEAIFKQAQAANRLVIETQSPTLAEGAGEPVSMQMFNPSAHSLLVTSMTAGG